MLRDAFRSIFGERMYMWKKQLTGAAIACALLLAGMMPVYAGGINAAEQRIVDYYNGTVTHNGKTYRFKPRLVKEMPAL